jgi:N-dimethylarginine dimethylaminohydrolase
MRTGDEPLTATLPATLGGPGFRARARSHRDDVSEGHIWRTCGGCSEADALLEVVLGWPPDALASSRPADEDLLLIRPDLERMRAEAIAIEAYFVSHGVTVSWVRACDAPPNLVFMRDLFFMTPEGAIVGRPAAEQRAGEPRLVAARLAELGVPILATVHGCGCFEGADALWLDEETVLLGLGRTNTVGASEVVHVLAMMGVATIPVMVPVGIQHLLGAVAFVEPRRAVLHARAIGTELEAVLRDRGVELMVLAEDDELASSRAMNFVALGGGRLVMPAGSPRAEARYRRAGWSPDTLDVGEYLKCAGGLGCIAGILRRASPDPRP